MTTAAQPTKPDALPESSNGSGVGVPEMLFPVTLRLPDAVVSAGPQACEDWFWEICQANQDDLWEMELNAGEELELMPTYAYSQRRESRLFFHVELWNMNQGSPGMATGPTGAFYLPNGAIRVPDASWTQNDKVSPPRNDPPRTWPFCPEFVAEVRSDAPSSIEHLLAKMQEYMANGAQLGWLIDPVERTVRIYRAGAAEPELLAEPATLDGESVLPGFSFDVRNLIFDLT